MNKEDGRVAFVVKYGDVFEHSAWVAEAAWEAGPFADMHTLHQAMCDAVRHAPREKKLALLCAHPELAGKEAREGRLTDASKNEQAGVGLSALTKDEMKKISELNRIYREKHGFPFIIAVRKQTKDSIFVQIRQRIENDTETEIQTALEQVFIIAQLRLGLG